MLRIRKKLALPFSCFSSWIMMGVFAVSSTVFLVLRAPWDNQPQSPRYEGVLRYDAPDECDINYHKGPYAIIEKPSQGFFNQYIKLVSTIYILRKFPGTIVFPRLVTGRTAYVDFHDTKWTETESKIYFDVQHFIDYWTLRNLSVCLESQSVNLGSKFLRKTSFCEQIVPTYIRANGLHVGKMAPEYCGGAQAVNLSPKLTAKILSLYFTKRNRNITAVDAVIFRPAWKIIPGQEFYRDRNDPNVLWLRESCESLHLSKTIWSVGKKLLNQIEVTQLSNNLSGTTVGIHARIEKDWNHRTSAVAVPAAALNRYRKYLNELPTFPILAYIAVGPLTTHEDKLLSEWANRTFGVHWYMKSSFNVSEDLRKLPIEAHAAVDFVVMLGLDVSLGQAESSFDFTVSEFRRYQGKHAALQGKLLDEFRPFLTATRSRT